MGQSGQAAKLAALAVAGQVIAYLLSAVLARRLGVDGFEAYVVASAAFMLMVTVAPRGIEKYALRILPALLARAEWGLARGFLHCGLRRTLLTSLIVGLAVGAWAWSVRDFAEATEMLYEHGTLDTRRPFAELRARSRINVQAKALDQDPEFSRLIREVLPDPRSPALPVAAR